MRFKETDSRFWIFISHQTGMPLAVLKSDTQPTRPPRARRSGVWVEFVRLDDYRKSIVDIIVDVKETNKALRDFVKD